MSDTLWAALMALAAAVIGAWKAWQAEKKTKAVEKKLDVNTAITEAGAEAVKANAEDAKRAVGHAQAAAANLESKLNGGIDDAIKTGVQPVADGLAELQAKFDILAGYTHSRNHDLLCAFQAYGDKVSAVLLKLGLSPPPPSPASNPGPAEPPTRGA